MTEYFFYHLLRRRLEEALPDLLQRTLARGWRAVVMASGPERVEALNGHLWTFSRDAFLPHGSKADGRAAEQPVWLTDRDENPNGASVLFLTEGMETATPGTYERVCDLFDGQDEAAVAAARERWKRAKAAGLKLTYWQENERGGFEKKAES